MTPAEQSTDPGALHDRREHLRRSLLFYIEWGDWHGVADAAMDLREVEATMRARGIDYAVECAIEELVAAMRRGGPAVTTSEAMDRILKSGDVPGKILTRE